MVVKQSVAIFKGFVTLFKCPIPYDRCPFCCDVPTIQLGLILSVSIVNARMNYALMIQTVTHYVLCVPEGESSEVYTLLYTWT